MKMLTLAAALLLAGCVTVPAVDPSALPTAPAAFKTAAVRPAASAEAHWWAMFRDPVLDRLVERAMSGNNALHVAAARLAQARAIAQATNAHRLPQLGAGASSAREGVAGNAVTAHAVGVQLAYEVDLFGRLAEATRAASLSADARESLLASTRLLVQAEVVQAYFLIRAIDAERTLVRDTLTAYRESLALTERRHAAGDVAELDVARVRSEAAATEAEALALDRRRVELENALAVLVGAAASEFSLGEREWDGALPAIGAGLPSTLLQRRPDLVAARQSMEAAQARVGVARTAWFPSISLTAEGGYASSDLSELLRWSARGWGIGALLALPIFDGGRREAEVARTRAELEAALAEYRERALVAFREVEDQLAALRLLSEQARAQASAVQAARRATALSEARYRNGYVSQLELLDAQRSELRNRRAALAVRSAQQQATVGLVRALGGGW